jgi:hypothetical protein
VETERDEGAGQACAKTRETRIGRNNFLVRPSIREARFTAGPITVKSSRSAAPTLPKITSPRCKPIPILTSVRLVSRRAC